MLAALSLPAPAATYNAATSSRTDVLAAIALASPGDTVSVPAGTSSWSGDISITGITLQGPGKDAGSPTVITAGTVHIDKHATHHTKLIGFRFTANGTHYNISGPLGNKPFVVGDCYFSNNGATMGTLDTNGGLFYSCQWVAVSAHSADTFTINLGGTGTSGQTSWEAAPSMGMDDPTGEINTYFEDCSWSGFLEVSMDVDNGARVVVRYCTFTDSSIVAHGGGGGNDTSQYGNKHVEIYNCTFDRVSNANAVNKWMWWRGGGGVFVNNSVEDASSPDGSSYPNKPEIQLSVGCPDAYPMTYQVGQAEVPADATPDFPIIITGNTGAGAGSGNFITIGENPNNACATPGDYIQSGRDYVTSNTWGWTAYTYPHPLRDDSPPAPPSGPGNTGLKVRGVRNKR